MSLGLFCLSPADLDLCLQTKTHSPDPDTKLIINKMTFIRVILESRRTEYQRLSECPLLPLLSRNL